MTVSPTTAYFTFPARPTFPAKTSPVWMPNPMRSGGSPSACQRRLSPSSVSPIASALSMAWRACSGSSSGAPKTARMASPMKSLTMPRRAKIVAVMASKYSVSRAAICSGGMRSDSVVKPRRSLKRMDTWRRSPASSAGLRSTRAATSGLT